MSRVRVPSPAPIYKNSIQYKIHAHIAQLVEYTLGKGEVTGSNPVMGSKNNLLYKEKRFILWPKKNLIAANHMLMLVQ